MINVFQPTVGEEELAAVGRVFASGWLGRGELARSFERELAAFLGVCPDNVLAINSCTTGLFVAMELLGVGPGDEVVLPTVHFVGAANAVVATGARPVFCDVDARTLNATAEDVLRVTTDDTAAVVLLHYGGVACDMEAIVDLARARGVAVVEDAACALGGTDDRTGGGDGSATRLYGTFGDIGVWSFDAMKAITTADGGAIYCRDAGMLDEARRRLWFGLDRQRGMEGGEHEWWKFNVSLPGGYGLMNDLAAAIGLEQLKKFDGLAGRRRQVCQLYDEGLGGLGWLERPTIPRAAVPHFYWVQTERRDALATYLRKHDIYTTFRYWPLHLVPFYGGGDAACPGAERAARTTLLLPLHVGLTDGDVERICGCVRDFGETPSHWRETLR